MRSACEFLEYLIEKPCFFLSSDSLRKEQAIVTNLCLCIVSFHLCNLKQGNNTQFATGWIFSDLIGCPYVHLDSPFDWLIKRSTTLYFRIVVILLILYLVHLCLKFKKVRTTIVFGHIVTESDLSWCVVCWVMMFYVEVSNNGIWSWGVCSQAL